MCPPTNTQVVPISPVPTITDDLWEVNGVYFYRDCVLGCRSCENVRPIHANAPANTVVVNAWNYILGMAFANVTHYRNIFFVFRIRATFWSVSSTGYARCWLRQVPLYTRKVDEKLGLLVHIFWGMYLGTCSSSSFWHSLSDVSELGFDNQTERRRWISDWSFFYYTLAGEKCNIMWTPDNKASYHGF